MAIAAVSISPVGAGTSVGRYVTEALRVVRAQDRWKLHRKRTFLFVDEIHRFNKAQQDALLPHVEKGTVTLIGATTENPSFEVNAALLSRCRVVTDKRERARFASVSQSRRSARRASVGSAARGSASRRKATRPRTQGCTRRRRCSPHEAKRDRIAGTAEPPRWRAS